MAFVIGPKAPSLPDLIRGYSSVIRLARKRRSGSCRVQSQRALVRRARFRRSGPGGGRDRRARSAPGDSPASSPRARMRVDQREAGRRAVAHRDRRGAIQLDDRRRLGAQQHVVQPDDLAPSRWRPRSAPRRAPRRSRPAACRGRSAATTSARSTSARPFGDLRAVPERAILIVEQHELARPPTCAPRAATRAAASARAGPPPRARAAARRAAGRGESPRRTGRGASATAPDEAE